MPRRTRQKATTERRIASSRKLYQRGLYNWHDPFPLGFGTVPEKMVYAALSKYGIPFYYLNDITFSDPEIDFLKKFQADFIIPDAKIIIEVQGARWHSTPQAIESDSYKFAVYESFGYTALDWWDYDIMEHLDQLFAKEPRLLALVRGNTPMQSTELTPMARTKTDTSKGIRTMNQKKRKSYKQFYGTSRKKLKKVKSTYGTTERKLR